MSREGTTCGDDLLFRAKRGGPIRESRFVQRYFKPLLKGAELPPIRLYDLRHTAATISLAAGVSPKIISEQLGHASVGFTLDVYSHVLPHMQDAAAEKVHSRSTRLHTIDNRCRISQEAVPVRMRSREAQQTSLDGDLLITKLNHCAHDHQPPAIQCPILPAQTRTNAVCR
jgi:hypothetical protein